MNDTVSLLIQAVEKRLKEIEEKIAPYNALIAERTELTNLLRRHKRVAGYTIGDYVIDIGDTSKLRWLNQDRHEHAHVADALAKNGSKTKNLIDDKSASSQINRALFGLLTESGAKRTKFSKLWELLPDTVRLAFKGDYAKQSAITAVKRAGHHFGIKYGKGAYVQLLEPDKEPGRGG
jgi:hypothetical protein